MLVYDGCDLHADWVGQAVALWRRGDIRLWSYFEVAASQVGYYAGSDGHNVFGPENFGVDAFVINALSLARSFLGQTGTGPAWPYLLALLELVTDVEHRKDERDLPPVS